MWTAFEMSLEDLEEDGRHKRSVKAIIYDREIFLTYWLEIQGVPNHPESFCSVKWTNVEPLIQLEPHYFDTEEFIKITFNP